MNPVFPTRRASRPAPLPRLTLRRARVLFGRAAPASGDEGAATAEYAIATMATVDRL